MRLIIFADRFSVEVYITKLEHKRQAPNFLCEISIKADNYQELSDQLVDVAETNPELIFGDNAQVTSVTADTIWRGPSK